MTVPKRGVHLFLGEVLLANRWTQRGRPAEWYEVAGVVYDVRSFVDVLDPDGSAGFDVQVSRRS